MKALISAERLQGPHSGPEQEKATHRDRPGQLNQDSHKATSATAQALTHVLVVEVM